jgi:hypothetical protein
MRVRRLTTIGISRFEAFIVALSSDSPSHASQAGLYDPDSSEPYDPAVEVERRSFVTRWEVAEYLDTQFRAGGALDVERDRGLWAWLSLFFFEELCVADDGGRRKPGALPRWIPEVEDYRSYYRHLLAGPYRVYRAHQGDPSLAMALLCGAPSKPGEIFEQLASRQELVTNAGVVGAATALYFDPKTKKFRRGAGGKGGGSARRLADVLNQLDLTFDLYAMDTTALLAVLPSEFDRFKPQRPSRG